MKRRWPNALRFLVALAAGCVAQQTAHAQSAFTTEYRYDSERRVVGTIAPDPDGTGPLHYAAVRNTYDADGRLTKVETGELATWPGTTAPSSWSGFTIFKTADYSYDADGRKTKDGLTADGAVQSLTQFSYDEMDRPVCTAVRMEPSTWASQTDACMPQLTSPQGPDRITRTIYNVTGTVNRIQKAFGTGIQQDYVAYTYDGSNQVATVTDANQNRAAYTYDQFNRLTRWYFPSKVSTGVASTDDYEAYTYDNNGNRLSLKKRDGSVFNYTYDAMSRNTVKIVPDGGGLIAAMTRDVYTGYDNRGLMTYARFDSGSGAGITNNYDNIGRLQNTTNSLIPGNKTLSFTYDPDGNRLQTLQPDGVHSDFIYDGMDRADLGSWNMAGGTYGFADYNYNAQGGRASRQVGSASTGYYYDGAGRLNNLQQWFPASSNNVVQLFKFNAASQIIDTSRDNDAFSWNGGVSINRAYAVNGLNQYTQSGPDNLGYDANGNLTSDTVGSTTTNWSYDRENRLVWTNLPTTTAIYYDPLGRLSMTNIGSTNRYFLYDGDNLINEFDGLGNVAKRYFFGPGTDEPLVEDDASFSCNNTRMLHADNQGSIIARADCSGNLTNRLTYDEYGIPGSGNVGRFGYTGQMWMPDIGLYYYKARMYSPTLGRFMQTDPIGYKDQINLYAYVGNDPVNGTDPTGLDTIVQLQWYPLGSLPVVGTWGHQFVIMRDTETGETVISRAGPYPAYGGSKLSAASDSPSKAVDGQVSRLQTAMTPAAKSTDNGVPGTKVVPGSTVTLKEPISDAKATLQGFNQAVDKASIPYTPRTENSNAYAATAYTVLTGKTAPNLSQLPGSNVNLKPQVPQCTSDPRVCGGK